MPKRPSTLQIWTALAVVYVVWGSTYLGIAIAIESFPPFLIMGIRFAMAGSILIVWEVLRNGRDFRRPRLVEVRDSAIVGALLLGVGNGFVALGQTSVPSGIAAILIAVIPLWFAILGRLYFKERLPKLVLLGIAIGLAGVALLVWPFGSGANALDLAGVAILIVAPIGWAHGSLFSAHRAQLPARPLMATGLQMLFGSIALFGEAILTGEPARFDPARVSGESLWAVLYLTLIGSLVAFNAYAWLLRNAPLSLVGTYAYVNPVVAVALGAVVLSEPITPRTLIASAVIIGAVAMIVTARGRAGRAEADADLDAAVTVGPGVAKGGDPGPSIGRQPPVGAAAISRAPAPRPGSSG